MADDAAPPAPLPPDPARELLVEAEIQLAGLGKTFDGPSLAELRSLVAGYPDLGLGGAGEVVGSLYMLLERLIASGRFDREAIAVHVRAWRLMQSGGPDEAQAAALIGGLKAVRDLYAESQAA